jgi:enoyl-CoA hydratase/carnithine racemase
MSLNYEKEGHVARVGLNRPKERNALDPQILMDLHEAWKDINADDAIRVVILHSCLPDIFCGSRKPTQNGGSPGWGRMWRRRC